MGEVSLREASGLLRVPYRTLARHVERWHMRAVPGIRRTQGVGRSRGGVRWWVSLDFIEAWKRCEIVSVLHVRR